MPTTQVPTLAANLPQLDADFSAAPPRRYFVFWPCFWLAVMLCATKAMHPGDPSAEGELASKEWLFDYLIFIHADLIFVLVIGVIWQILLALFARRAKLAQVVWRAGLIVFVGCALYAVISVPVFENLGTPLTYPLLHVAGNVGNMRSSLAAYMTFKLVAAIVVVPIGFALLVWCCNRVVPMRRALIRRSVIALCTAAIVTNGIYAHREYEVWSSRDDRAIADNPHWVLLSTTCKEFVQSDVATLHEDYPPEFAREFAPPPARLASAKLPGVQMNVIVVVLESVAAKYLSVYGAPYEATPQLHAEASNSLIVENVHSHVGMTANSLVSMLLGVYPPITWRQLTRDRPDYPGTSLAQVMHDAGYRTAYITSADIGYVSTDKFLKNRGFDVIDDVNSMGAPYSFSWGTEDRYMIDGLLRFIDADHTRPFFAMTWTQQTHHPYSASPDQPEIDFSTAEPSGDPYHLGQYLNALHESDRQIGRLIGALRERKLDQQTMIVVVGDHGEAFGWPHLTFAHGARVYEENLHVPFIVWCPRVFSGGRRSGAVGGLIDLGPTIVDLCATAQPTSWQGTSLLSASHSPRAYFSAANDGYYVALRQGQWKYIYNATLGKEELFDLSNDPHEQKNVATQERDFCRTSRQHLAAWVDSFQHEER